ncbi:2'-5' RNA ligase family protein [Streptomyces sp. NRRL WC-3742]|uniref:2'-5' RNA ligase family protein n=1 Tax=Streptomyces sp. NRRL WC-3742 TaxID=1463934 RepID=UPI0004C517DE|nr:2'-5' RNA ligase family protein [Streptomyces sp. NRRL WC-3742]
MLRPSARSFPPAPPLVDTMDAIAANDWDAFAGLTCVTRHWDRPGWTPDRRVYYWMITFPAHGAPHDLAQQCQAALTGLGLDPIPTGGLHITVLRVGDRKLVQPDLLRRLTADARALRLRPFSLELRPLAGSPGAVRLSVGPWGPLIGLHHALTRLGQSLGIPGGRPTDEYRPHLGIGYNPIERPAAAVVEAVAALRTLPAVHTVVDTVALVELRREPGRYAWDTIARVPLCP